MPPRWIRRLVLTPLIPLLTVVLFATLPISLIVAAVASTFLPGRWRALRVLTFALVYLVVDTAMLVWLFVLWVGSGFGRQLSTPRWQQRHYDAMRRYLAVLVAAGRRVFRVGFDVDTDDLDFTREELEHPVLVFSRHAGPGDSFLLVHALLQARQQPRIVLKGALQWSPVIDTGLNRLPTGFVQRGAPPGTGTRMIRELAEGMGPRGALVLFPEGRNWTPSRRLLSIDALEAQGRHDEAEAAREMRHVLTPRTGGAIAALEGAPSANVAFVAHTGLEHLSSAVDLWRGMPVDADVAVKGWRVPRGEVPTARAAQDAWLQWWWRRIDAWLLTQVGAEELPDAVVEAVTGQQAPPPTT